MRERAKPRSKDPTSIVMLTHRIQPIASVLLVCATLVGCRTSPDSSPETLPDDWSPLKPAQISTALNGEVDFVTHVRPVLTAKCVYCHQGATSAGGFNMERRASFMAAGAKGPRVVPGSPAKSLLVANVSKTHEKVQAMPPVGNRVTKDELLLLKRWIAQGVPWPESVARLR
jgi:uncharacterized membrane protein